MRAEVRTWDYDDEGVRLFLRNGDVECLQFVTAFLPDSVPDAHEEALQFLLAHCKPETEQ